MLTENKLFGDRETVANDSIVADNATIGNSIAPKTHHLDRHHRFELLEKRGLNSDWVEVKGTGDWGLGIGDWGLGTKAKNYGGGFDPPPKGARKFSQYPVPSPQSRSAQNAHTNVDVWSGHSGRDLVNCQSVSVLSARELLGYLAPFAEICRSQPEHETQILSLRNQGVSNYSIKSWNPLGERYQT